MDTHESLKIDQHNTYYQMFISNIQMQLRLFMHKWIDSFTQLDVLIGVRTYIGEEAFMTFDVHFDGSLNFTHTKIYLYSFCLHK